MEVDADETFPVHHVSIETCVAFKIRTTLTIARAILNRHVGDLVAEHIVGLR